MRANPYVQPLTGIVIVTAFPRELDRVEEFINAHRKPCSAK